MAVTKETSIHRYIGLAGDTRPTGVPAGSTYLAYDTDALEITYDGTNWVQVDKLVKLVANSGVDIGDVDILSIAAGNNNIGNVDLVTLPSGNLGQQAKAASLSVAPATDITDATYLGDIKFGESLPSGSAVVGKVRLVTATGDEITEDTGDTLKVTSAQLPTALAASGGIKIEGVAGGVAVPISGAVTSSGTATVTQGTAAAAAAGWPAKDDGPSVAGTSTYTTSADMTTAAAISPAPTAGQKLKLLEIDISSDTAMLFSLQEETSAAVFRAYRIPANGTVPRTYRFPPKLATADKKWFGKASVAGNVYITTTVTSES